MNNWSRSCKEYLRGIKKVDKLCIDDIRNIKLTLKKNSFNERSNEASTSVIIEEDIPHNYIITKIQCDLDIFFKDYECYLPTFLDEKRKLAIKFNEKTLAFHIRRSCKSNVTIKLFKTFSFSPEKHRNLVRKNNGFVFYLISTESIKKGGELVFSCHEVIDRKKRTCICRELLKKSFLIDNTKKRVLQR